MSGSRRALITGAAGDIGRAAAIALLSQGWDLILADHPVATDRLRSFIDENGMQHRATPLALDVTSRSAVSEALTSMRNAGTVPNALFNNAGVQGQFARLDEIDETDLRQVFEVNVFGAFGVLAEWAAVLISEGLSGAAVNSASMAGVGGAPNMAAYSGSKSAIIAITKSAAKDFAPMSIRVNSISPAFIGPGAMWDRQVALQAATGSQYFSSDPEEVSRQMIAMVPLRRFGSTAEVASVVAFLLSDQASYLTGINIEIAGGSV